MLFCKACQQMVDPPEEGPAPDLCASCGGALGEIPRHPDAAPEEPPPPDAEAASGASAVIAAEAAAASGKYDTKRSTVPKLETFHKYRIIEKLGAGGMGVVYRARDPLLKRELALKIFRPNLFEDPSYLVRFRHEAEVAARLHHPNIASLYEFGIYDQCPYYTMELIDGESLSAVIQRMGRLPTRAALLVSRDCAQALHYAHTQGVIHRDIKSANILIRNRRLGAGPPADPTDRESKVELASGVTSEFQAVLLDFGLAHMKSADQAVTQAGDLVGTPSYMSPEQVSGRLGVTTARSDIFSLGVVLYESLTGQLPFTGEELHVMLSKIESEDPLPPRHYVRTLHRDVEAIVLKAMEKNPEKRYETAESFAADVDRYMRGEITEARPSSAIDRAWRKVRKHKHLLIPPAASLVVMALIFAYLGIYVPLQRKSEARETEKRLLGVQVEHKRSVESQARAGRAEAEARLARGDFEGCITLSGELETKFGERLGALPDRPKVEFIDWEKEPDYQALNQPFDVPIPALHLIRGQALQSLGRKKEAMQALVLAYQTGSLHDAVTARRSLLLVGNLLEIEGKEADALRGYTLVYRDHPGTLQSDEAAFQAGLLSLKLGDPNQALQLFQKARASGRLTSTQNSTAERSISLLKQWVPEYQTVIYGQWLGVGDFDDPQDAKDELIILDSRGRLRIQRLEPDGWNTVHEQQLLSSGAVSTMLADELPVRLAFANLDGKGRPELIVATRHPQVRTGSLAVFEWKDKEYELVATLRLGPKEETLNFVTAQLSTAPEQQLVIPSRSITGGLRVYRLTPQGLQLQYFFNLYGPPTQVVAANIDENPGDELIVALAGDSPGLVLLRRGDRNLRISDRFSKPCRISGLKTAHTD
ncbi:MAG TPA: serine/threonine-protein kinase, partial [Planctomycetota bacterium]|nr:serine/threonine-protein kinase [Planctomycetota bacterium]